MLQPLKLDCSGFFLSTQCARISSRDRGCSGFCHRLYLSVLAKIERLTEEGKRVGLARSNKEVPSRNERCGLVIHQTDQRCNLHRFVSISVVIDRYGTADDHIAFEEGIVSRACILWKLKIVTRVPLSPRGHVAH